MVNNSHIVLRLYLFYRKVNVTQCFTLIMSTLEIICGTMGASKDEWNGSSANLTKMCMTTH